LRNQRLASHYGRVSRYGAMALSYSMDKIGPLARSAEDCAPRFRRHCDTISATAVPPD